MKKYLKCPALIQWLKLDALMTTCEQKKTNCNFAFSRAIGQSWALEVFLKFSNNKKFWHLLQIVSAPVLFKEHTPSQINLIKNAKNHFYWGKKYKNSESAQLCF